jgi:sodium-independent sulfate anion transporter 11
VFNWLPHYRPSTAVADLVAGVTVGLTLIPQAIAYASLAGLQTQVIIAQNTMTGCLVYCVGNILKICGPIDLNETKILLSNEFPN